MKLESVLLKSLLCFVIETKKIYQFETIILAFLESFIQMMSYNGITSTRVSSLSLTIKFNSAGYVQPVQLSSEK